jgi:hypothetical protein
MNSEQTGEDIFEKLTLFSLLKFKFTQIFLMDQNSFFFQKWSSYRWMRPNYRWIWPNYWQMRPNFGFLEDYCPIHTSNAVRTNFSEFHRFFLKFSKINGIGQLRFFCSAWIFKHWLAVIKSIYLPPTYLHFIQDIEDSCLLLTSSMSFVDLPFREHPMREKQHTDQNPYISSLCAKPGVVSNNMTQGDDVQKSRGPTDPRWGRPTPLVGRPCRVWCQWNTLLTRVMLSR